MSERHGNPNIEKVSTGPTYSAFDTWIKAVITPSKYGYEEIIGDPKASIQRAALWLFVTSLAGVGFATMGLVPPFIGTRTDLFSREVSLNPQLPVYITFLVVSAGISVIVSLLNAGIAQIVADYLGGNGTYTSTVYAFSAFTAPLILLNSVIAPFEPVRLLTVLVSVYALFLNVIANRAVHNFGWGKALVCTIAIIVFWILLTVCLALGFMNMGDLSADSIFSLLIERFLPSRP